MKTKNILPVLIVVLLVGVIVLLLNIKTSLNRNTLPKNPSTENTTQTNGTGATEPNKQLIGGQKDEHGCLIAAGYSWCEAKQKCLRTWEEPCVSSQEEEQILVNAMREAIVAKRGPTANQLTFKVSKVEGDYASGSASASGGGGMWFAAKVNGKWTLVWDGNGAILCKDLEPYPNFPSDLIPEC